MKQIKSIAIICLLLCAVSKAENIPPTTAILGAMSDEVEMLMDTLTERDERKIQGIRFVTGKMNGRQVVVARTGVGKVNAAMTATLLVEHFSPSEVIVTGVAGRINPGLSPGDIVIAKKTAQHDFGDLTAKGIENWGARNPINGERNPVFFPMSDRLLTVAKASVSHIEFEKIGTRAPKVIEGIVVTGDVFVSSDAKVTELRKSLQADAVEMEGAAIAQICWQQGVPCLIIRSISDNADAKANQDYEQFSKIAARNSAKLVEEIVKQLGSGASREEKPTLQPNALTPYEKEFQEMLSGSTLVGHFTMTGQENKTPREEKYTIKKVSKMRDNVWLFVVRVQYGNRDVTVPLPLEVQWAGDTPMVTLTDVELPRLGTYTARVLFYRNQYAGTWSGGDHGGQLFGRIIKTASDAAD
ncbi:5'-methylthioadenosine/adenosylhomocysteine nucleosidase [Candidatus Poribacteria bacterium]|nr:5'-methylthioadenosine/adenosylhomocysteine nucleosidase [Candidatus Poribacteria bacterium]